jgi:hypothetical protein
MFDELGRKYGLVAPHWHPPPEFMKQPCVDGQFCGEIDVLTIKP